MRAERYSKEEGRHRAGRGGKENGQTDPVRRLRLRLVLLLCALYLVSIAGMLVVFNVTYRKSSQSEIRQALVQHLMILQRESEEAGTGERPPAGTSGAGSTAGEDELFAQSARAGSGAAVYSITEIYTVRQGAAGAEVVDRSPSAQLTQREIRNVGNAVLSQGKASGTWRHYQYVVQGQGENRLAVFTDTALLDRSALRLSLQSLGIGLAFFLLWGLICLRLSAVLVRPMREAMDKQRDFLMMAGHELKTPLAVLRTSLQMMEREKCQEPYLTYAMQESAVMTDIVTDLLDLTRLEATAPQMEEMSLSDCVLEAVLPMEAQAFERSVLLEEEVDEGVIIRGEEKLLLRLVSTLTDNAIRHTRRGGKVVVELSGRTLRVKNQGEPIPEEERERLFEKFYRPQSEPQEDDGQRHYGLGLAIAASIAREHGTAITIDCADGWVSFSVVFA